MFGRLTDMGGGIIPLWWAIKHLHIYAENCDIEINSKIDDVHIYMYGSNHKLCIDTDVQFKQGTICFEDNSCVMQIGTGTTIQNAMLSVAENNCKLIIGKDCMFSTNIYISTTDSHSIISTETDRRINPPASVYIADHVWIGYNCTINKGVHIESNSIVGGNSVVTKDVKPNVIVAGIPAQIIKTDVNWDRIRR